MINKQKRPRSLEVWTLQEEGLCAMRSGGDIGQTHLLMHCRWKAWEQVPQTTGQSSPGYLASGGQASKEARQIPQTSSPVTGRGRGLRTMGTKEVQGMGMGGVMKGLPAFHVQLATACQLFMFTLKVMAGVVMLDRSHKAKSLKAQIKRDKGPYET